MQLTHADVDISVAFTQDTYRRIGGIMRSIEEAENLCPRCRQQDADPIFLGSGSEGHICGTYWAEDRRRDDANGEITP